MGKRTPRQRGVPPKLTPDSMALFFRLIEQGNTISDTCGAVGISHQTYRNWYNAGEALAERIEAGEPVERTMYLDFFEGVTRAQAKARELAVAAIHSAIIGNQTIEEEIEAFEETRYSQDGTPYTYHKKSSRRKTIKHPPDPTSAFKLLARQDPRQWSETLMTKVGFDQSEPMTIRIVYDDTLGAGEDDSD